MTTPHRHARRSKMGNKVVVRAVNESDREAWRVLYRGYRDFYKAPHGDEAIDTVWSWLHDEGHETRGLVALVDVPLNSTGSTIDFSLWARNLMDEEYLFYKMNSASLGQAGIFNDPRTYGLDVTVHF